MASTTNAIIDFLKQGDKYLYPNTLTTAVYDLEGNVLSNLLKTGTIELTRASATVTAKLQYSTDNSFGLYCKSNSADDTTTLYLSDSQIDIGADYASTNIKSSATIGKTIKMETYNPTLIDNIKYVTIFDMDSTEGDAASPMRVYKRKMASDIPVSEGYLEISYDNFSFGKKEYDSEGNEMVPQEGDAIIFEYYNATTGEYNDSMRVDGLTGEIELYKNLTAISDITAKRFIRTVPVKITIGNTSKWWDGNSPLSFSLEEIGVETATLEPVMVLKSTT